MTLQLVIKKTNQMHGGLQKHVYSCWELFLILLQFIKYDQCCMHLQENKISHFFFRYRYLSIYLCKIVKTFFRQGFQFWECFWYFKSLFMAGYILKQRKTFLTYTRYVKPPLIIEKSCNITASTDDRSHHVTSQAATADVDVPIMFLCLYLIVYVSRQYLC